MKALVLDAEARTAKVGEVPQPQTAAGEILVKVEVVSLNPIDPLFVANPIGKTGRIVGCDFAGTVAAFGESEPSDHSLKVGDRVAGFLQGACSVNDRPGAFAEYVVILYDLVWKVPDGVRLEQASGTSLCALTAAQVMWYRFGLPALFEYDRDAVLNEHPNFPKSFDKSLDEINILIYGASTSVGLFAAQLARLTGKVSGGKVKLFGAASKARWPKLNAEPYSYDHLIDYRDKDWPEQVRSLSKGVGMHYVLDAITEGSSTERSASTLSNDGKALAVTRAPPILDPAPAVPVLYGAALEGLGEEVHYKGGRVLPKSPTGRDFAAMFYHWLSGAVKSKELEPMQVRTMPGGLDNIVGDGFRLLGAGNMDDRDRTRTEEWMKPVGAEKLVYQI
jgi:NADPH:quinone reductase-like Zn-dependent oxidoreductase